MSQYHVAEEEYDFFDSPLYRDFSPEPRIVKIDGIPHRIVMPRAFWLVLDEILKCPPETYEEFFEDVLREAYEEGVDQSLQAMGFTREVIDGLMMDGVPPYDQIDPAHFDIGQDVADACEHYGAE